MSEKKVVSVGLGTFCPWIRLIGFSWLLAAADSRAEESKTNDVALQPVDKNRFTLWNPTPRDSLREMEALYRSPYTVDAGHVQVESYLAGYEYARETRRGTNTRTETWRVAPTTLKLGVLNDLDLELELRPYTRVRFVDRITGTTSIRQGFGDLIPKAKLNLCGNDGGSLAVALLPFVKIPTNHRLGNDAVEAGFALPLNLELPWNWWLGISPEFSWLEDDDGHGRSPAFANVGYLWHAIVGGLSGYLEFSNWMNFEQSHDWIGTFDLGLTYQLGKNIQLDAGVVLGVTASAPVINPFLGASFRF